MPILAIELLIFGAIVALLVNEICIRTRPERASRPAKDDKVWQKEVDTLNQRIRDLERIIIDPDEKLRRDIDRL